jgi:branched-chain amino acid aminotransferase
MRVTGTNWNGDEGNPVFSQDELFFSGSSAKVWPITSVDKRRVGTGEIGSITSQLIELYANVRQKKIILNNDWYSVVGKVK